MDSKTYHDAERVYVPGVDDKYHIGDGNGGTLCGVRMSGENHWLDEICDKCETLRTPAQREASLRRALSMIWRIFH